VRRVPGSPRFTVVVPAFDAERTIGSALRSVVAQTERDLEVIVVDDGSRDRTVEAARAVGDPRLRIISQANRGLPGARNAAIAAARGRLVALLDADDLWMPTYLERMGAALEARPDAGMAYCDAWVFEDGTGRVRRATIFARRRPAGPLPPDPAAFLLVHLLDNFFYVGTTIRADVLERVGGFREDMTSLEDYEMWLRIQAAGLAAVEVPEPLALYRTSPHQMSADTGRMTENLLRLCAILEAREDLPPGARAVIARRRREALRDRTAAAPGASLPRLQVRLRALAATVVHALPGHGVWCDRPPAEVAAAFTELSRV
jgi:glycosyltransferase involved in cell wall biosynthesis